MSNSSNIDDSLHSKCISKSKSGFGFISYRPELVISPHSGAFAMKNELFFRDPIINKFHIRQASMNTCRCCRVSTSIGLIFWWIYAGQHQEVVMSFLKKSPLIAALSTDFMLVLSSGVGA